MKYINWKDRNFLLTSINFYVETNYIQYKTKLRYDTS